LKRNVEQGVMIVDVKDYLLRAVEVSATISKHEYDLLKMQAQAATTKPPPPPPPPPANAGTDGKDQKPEAQSVSPEAAQAVVNYLSTNNRRPETLTDALALFEASAQIMSAINKEVPKSQRDALVGMMVLASDRNCDLYLDNLRKTQATYQSSFLMAGMVLSGAAGFTPTDVRTARVLSGLSSMSTGAADTLNRSVFAQQNASVIIGGIEKSRSAVRAELMRRTDADYSKWRMSQAIADAYQYHGQCSISAGLAYLSSATGVNSELQANLLKQLSDSQTNVANQVAKMVEESNKSIAHMMEQNEKAQKEREKRVEERLRAAASTTPTPPPNPEQ
jgi:hypothetical protein